MAKVMKSRAFRGFMKFKSKKSKVKVLAILVIILIIVASTATFLFFGDNDLSRKYICRKNNAFLSTSSPYGVLSESNNKENLQNKKPSSIKNSNKGVYGDQKVPILTYHYIAPVPPFTSLPNLYQDPVIFENQLSVLKDNSYNTVFARDLGNTLNRRIPIPENSIILTFDDGYGDFYTTVYPLMKKYDMKAVLYVIGNFMDKPGYITSAQAKEMAQSGYVEIGSHTMDHVNLKKASNAESFQQLYESRKKLSEVIGRPVDSFAYPFGFFSSRDMGVASRVGYISAASTYPGVMQSYKNKYSLFRLRPGNRTGQEFLDWLKNEQAR